MNRKSFIIGALMALIPGVLWGLSGVFGQYLFQQRGDECRVVGNGAAVDFRLFDVRNQSGMEP